MLIGSLLENPFDLVALGFFIVVWIVFSAISGGKFGSRPTLTMAMNNNRRAWMKTMSQRELRMIDTNIMNGLQQGTAFFASSCIIAVGGCFALLGSADRVLNVLSDIPATVSIAKPVFEAKILGLIGILSYAFFKFGWSYRLFNYCSILVGAVPLPGAGAPNEIEVAAERAAKLNILAGRHFDAGLQAIFFSAGYLGWFIGPWFFIASTIFVAAVLTRRQFFSAARLAVLEDK